MILFDSLHESQTKYITSKYFPRALIVFQSIIMAMMYFQARSTLIWVWNVISFIPATLICLTKTEKKVVLFSLVLLFSNQFAVYVFAHPTWGYSFHSDSINDFHIASVVSERSHFVLGQAGYTERSAYSYYPFLHLLAILLGKISALPLTVIALYFVPFLNALLVPILLYFLNQNIFGLKKIKRNIATLFFSLSWYYSFFHSQFVREVLAFPFALSCLFILTKIMQSYRRPYILVFLLASIAVTLSHHITSYVTLILIFLIVLGKGRSGKSSTISMFLLFVAVLFIYTAFVSLNFMIVQGLYAIRGLQKILNPEPVSILKPFIEWQRYLVFSYYILLGVLALVGSFKLLLNRKNRVAVLFICFFEFLFALCVLLRFSTSAHPWSWTYYMSLRGTIWAFIGISVCSVYGMDFLLFRQRRYIYSLIVVSLICFLALGKFAHNSPLISDASTAPPVTYSRYISALWLKEVTIHGAPILVAPYNEDPQAFESSRDIAPYAYLREYYLGDSTQYVHFNGYIAFVGDFFEQFRGNPYTQKIYSNGETDIGYKERQK